MIDTREQCEAFVGAMRYFPDGYRSRGPTRARIYAGDDYAEKANEEVIAMAMVETKTAVDNIDGIVGVPHLDAIYVGPGDLSLTLGCERVGADIDEPIFNEAIDTILAACKKAGVIAGIHTASPVYARKMAEKGFQFITLSSDSGMLGAMAQSMIDQFNGIGGDAEASMY